MARRWPLVQVDALGAGAIIGGAHGCHPTFALHALSENERRAEEMRKMPLTDDQMRALATAAGVAIPEGEIADVTIVFNATLKIVDMLRQMDTEGLVPATVFPDEEA